MPFPPTARPSVRTGAELILGAVLVAAVLWQTHEAHAAERRAGAAALEADTMRATLDTSRNVAATNAKVAKLAGDSLAFAQRQAVQVAQRADSLDKALGLERTARVQLVTRVRDLATHDTTGHVTVTNATDTATRRATFSGRQAPYTYTATAALPAPGAGPGSIDLSVHLDSIPLELRPGCSPANAAGIRSAFVTVKAPSWAPVTVGRVEQDPDVCRSPALEPRGAVLPWWRRAVNRLGISAGYGVTLESGTGGKVGHGPAIVAGVKLWP